MSRLPLSLIVVAVAGLTAGPVFAQPGRGPSPREVVGNGWLSDYQQAKDRALQSGKPIMLVFRCIP
jgi:hypothetical protein